MLLFVILAVVLFLWLSWKTGGAILDRIVHSAHRINLKGESMRKKLIKKD